MTQDDRGWRVCARSSHRSGGSSIVSCRSCSRTATRRRSKPCGNPMPPRCWSRTPGGCGAGARRGAPRRVHAAHAGGPPRGAARDGRAAVVVRAVPVRARSRPAGDAHGRRRARRGARTLSARPASERSTTLEQLFATKEIVVCCGSGGVGKTSVAAAAALGAAIRLGGKTLGDHRPCPPPGDRARPRRHWERSPPRSGRGAQAGRARAARRVVGGDARHQAVVGRPRAPARSRCGTAHPHSREPHVHQPHRAVRPEPRLHRDGATVRDPRIGRVRPDRGRHHAHLVTH